MKQFRIIKNGGGSMNKTKRKIFETSMKLFAEKGYDATSIEDIIQSMGSKRVRHDWATELNWTELTEEKLKLGDD